MLRPSLSAASALALPLLMLGVLADHPHHPTAMDDLTLVTYLFDRCPNFHNLSPQLARAEPLLVAVNNPAAGQIVRT